MDAYREQSGRGAAHQLAWSALGTATRERLTAACLGEAALLADVIPGQVSFRRMLTLGAGSGVLLGSLLASVWRSNPFLGSDGGSVVTSVVLGGVLGAALVLDVWSWWLRRGRLFPSGTYLFTRDLVVIEGSQVRVVPTSTLTAVDHRPGKQDPDQGQVTLQFEGGERHTLRCDAATGDGLEAQLRRLQQALEEATRVGDLAAVERLDPLRDERPAWSQQTPAPPGPRAVRWRWQRAAVAVVVAAATGLGMFDGANAYQLACHLGHQRRVDEALARSDQDALESIARETGGQAAMADLALDRLALHTNTARALQKRIQKHHTEELDRAFFAHARDSYNLDFLWSYVSLPGLRKAEAEQRLIERTLQEGTLPAARNYLSRAPDQPEIEALRGSLELAQARQGDLQLLQKLADDPRPSPLRDEARSERHRQLASQMRDLQRDYPGRLGQLLVVALARQDEKGEPLRMVVQGDAPLATRQAAGREVPGWVVREAIYEQLRSVVVTLSSRWLLRRETDSSGYPIAWSPYSHRWPQHTDTPLPGPTSPREPEEAASSELRVSYSLQPAGGEQVRTRLELRLHTPEGAPLTPPIEVRFTAPGPTGDDFRPFATGMVKALRSALAPTSPDL